MELGTKWRGFICLAIAAVAGAGKVDEPATYAGVRDNTALDMRTKSQGKLAK